MRRVLRESFAALFPFDVQRYIDQAIRARPYGVSLEDYAYSLIIRSPQARARMAGNYRPDGTLRYSPQEFFQREASLINAASKYGIALNRHQIAGLMVNDRTGDEAEVAFQGIQLARTNKPYLDRLNSQIDYLNARRRAHGYTKMIPRINGAKEAVNFFTGRADRELYAVAEGASFQTAAKAAGIHITAHHAQQLAAKEGFHTLEEAEQSYGEIAARLRKAAPELKGFGITREQLETIEFGGPNRAALAAKAEQALKQREAALQAPVQQQVGAVSPIRRADREEASY